MDDETRASESVSKPDPSPLANEAPITWKPDLRPLGSGGEGASPLDSTPLIPLDSGIIQGGGRESNDSSHSLLPLPPAYVDPAAARRLRNRLDPVGHWDAVVACATPVGSSSPLVDGAVHVFLNSGSLVRQRTPGLEIHKARLVSLLNDGLGASCTGFWLYGLTRSPEFLPAQDLAPMAETLSVIVTLAKAASGSLTPDEALTQLLPCSFFYDATSAGPEAWVPLFVSPVHLLQSGHAGNTAMASLEELVNNPEEPALAGFVIEPGAGYSLTIPINSQTVQRSDQPEPE